MKRFAGVGLPATSGDHRACWSRPRRDLHTGASSSSAGRRLASERCGSALFLFRWSWAGRCSTSVPEKVCFLPLPFHASEFDSRDPSAVASPGGNLSKSYKESQATENNWAWLRVELRELVTCGPFNESLIYLLCIILMLHQTFNLFLSVTDTVDD